MPTIDLNCPRCKAPYQIEAEMAAHDEQLLDVVVQCRTCNRTLNSFIDINEMMVLDEGASSDSE
ncbi:hypothetical bacteriophage protein [Pseudomonas chlororaphis subsp. aurantiaca]|uniref:MJ0042-type zinc finger domain-containing protein n=1 Tax=Pseudomonas chlororaphis TaxID=587753 RepID=UPI000865F037|nr:MJ0042-type zinc finger domain-containing protein [Pseudomonas chlororaphis]BAV74143.1 hypothetical bacteriophage protein [Pseudomonas chlororaphis subsp. aurantiaca]